MVMLPSTSGVYFIECSGNDKIYVGSGLNMRTRQLGHLSDLRRNDHSNIRLQRSFNKYGENSFLFYVLEEISPDIMRKIEAYWIKALDAVKHGFNICYDTVAWMKGLTQPPSVRAKISAILKLKARRGPTHPNFGKKLSPEICAKMSAARSGSKNWRWGKQCSPELKAAISAAQLGRIKSPEIIEKLRRTLMGRSVSTETRAKISLAQKGKARTWPNGHPFLGKTHTATARAAISKAFKGKPWTSARRAAFLKGRLQFA